MSRRERIEEKIVAELSPLHFEVIDESGMHNVPEGAESHFKLVVVSERFSEHRPVGRHRLLNRLLADEFSTGMHALALHTWTPEEWFKKAGQAPESPQCMGGSKGA